MTFLPVVQRELRVASRERNTYRVRLLAALVPILFCAFSLWVVTLFDEGPIPPRDLFLALTWISYVFVMLAGFCLTSDTISEEKRENTLGLLFLTDLGGLDVVLGKLAGAGVRGLYAMLATAPVLAIPILMGGTNAPEFARVALVLVLTLLFSMSVGIFSSTVTRKTWTSLSLSFGIMIFFVLVLPVSVIILKDLYRWTIPGELASLPSPSTALILGLNYAWFRSAPTIFLWSTASIAGMSLALLAISTLLTPIVWKDRPPALRWANLLNLKRALTYGTANFRPALRRRLLAINPILWLARRHLVGSGGLMLIILGCAAVVGWIMYKVRQLSNEEEALMISFVSSIFCGAVVHTLMALRVTISAAERFGEDRRSGALELLLSTIITVPEVLRGHWQALTRQFTGPAILTFLVHLQPIAWLLMLQPILTRYETPRTALQLITDILNHLFLRIPITNQWEIHFGFLIFAGLIPVLFINWIALASVSMWLSLRVKRALAAPIAALFLVTAPPWIVLGLGTAIANYNHWNFNHDFDNALFVYASAAFLLLANQLLWIRLSHRKMLRHFRSSATDRYQPPAKPRWWLKPLV